MNTVVEVRLIGQSATPSINQQIVGMQLPRSSQDLFGMLERLCGDHPDYDGFAVPPGNAFKAAQAARPADLKRLNLKRDLEPDWFLRPDARLRLLHRSLQRQSGRGSGSPSTSTSGA